MTQMIERIKKGVKLRSIAPVSKALSIMFPLTSLFDGVDVVTLNKPKF